MATAGEQIIKEKIEGLNDLPVGYTPNLQSKWEVLESGLKPKKRRLFFIWNRYTSIAAAFLFIGGAGLLLIKNINNKPQSADVVKPKIEVPEANLQVVTIPAKETEKRVRNFRSKKPTRLQQVMIPQLDTAIQDPIFIEHIEPVVATLETTAIKKPKRFEEIDFNTPVIGTSVPTQTYVESQKFRFRIGFGGGTKTASSQSKQPAVSLSTAF